MLGYFALQRLEQPLEPRASRRLNPIYSIARFMAQPRLRLSWVLAVGRSAWWSMFQIYAPVYAIKTGLGAETGGLIVSIGVGWMWTVLLWGWLGRRFGIRRLLLFGYAATGCVTLATVPAMGTPLLGATMLVLSALVAETIDGAGNSLFLRAVHVHERSEMTSVFVTYRDFGQTAPPAVFAALLAIFELPAVFVAGGLMMLAMAGLTRYIPRRF
jgi:predicted MFS family arabinose efflux permease